MRTQMYPKCHQFRAQRKEKNQTDQIRPSACGWSLSFNCKEKQSLQSVKATQEWLQLFPLNEPERTDGLLLYCHKGQN